MFVLPPSNNHGQAPLKSTIVCWVSRGSFGGYMFEGLKHQQGVHVAI